MSHLQALLSRWVGAVARRAGWVVALAALSAAGALHYTAGHLGMNTDTADMIARELPWRQNYIEYKRLFPQDTDTLTVVVDGQTPELAEDAAARLAGALAAPDVAMAWVYRPDGGRFWARNGLLYLSVDALAERADALARYQPFLGRLAGDPSVPGLMALMAQALDGETGAATASLGPVLDAVAAAVGAALDGRFHRLSWQTLMDPDGGGAHRRFVIAKPRLDYAELLPAGPAIARVRAAAAGLDLDPAHGVRVRITGGVALAHEELRSVSRGAEVAALSALILVAAVLGFGLRSVRLVAASLVTLLVGLLWTAAFATLAVGHLNLISVAFAVLYIGLGVDYAIHYCLRYRELLAAGTPHGVALSTAAADVGGALVLCALTTGIGFYSFVPTDFSGVSELGLISGTGIFIGLVASLTVLPALLSLAPLPRTVAAQRAAARPTRRGFPYRHRHAILALAGASGIAALAVVPGARFDSNPLNLRDPGTESVQTYQDLLADSERSPWPIALLVPGPERAAAAKAALEALPGVARVLTLADFVPADQDAKLALIEELDLLLGPALASLPAEPVASPPAAQRAALSAVRARLDHPAPELARPAAHLRAALERAEAALAGADGPALAARLTESLLGSVPALLERLALGLAAAPVSRADLPPELVSRWTAQGRERVEVYARGDLTDPAVLEAFVAEVRAVAPEATGTPVVHLESGRAVVGAFAQALVSALVLITALLLALFRRLRELAWVLAPLLFAGLLTVAGMAALGIPFNFANVIALPLLLGIGVDNGIHMVHRLHAAPPPGGDLLATSTARGVVVSALTTLCSFGNLAFSAHRGTASMGVLLSLGLALTLICTLVLLPALLGPRRTESTP